MAHYEWSSDLDTGNYTIDNQHRSLFNRLNDLIDAKNEKRGVGELYKALEFLTVYVVEHFFDEEKLACDYLYPDREAHKKIHDEFKIVVKKLTDEIRKEGYTDAILDMTIKIVSDWLVVHIKGEDFKLAQYIKAYIDNQE